MMFVNNTLERQEIIDEMLDKIPRVKTCVHSRLPEGRMWCDERRKTTVGGYCTVCPHYSNN